MSFMLSQLHYTYNADGTVASVSDKSDLSSLSSLRGTTSYLYDAVGDVTQIAQQNTSGYGASGITSKSVNFTYNVDGSPDTSASLTGESFSYDFNGNRTASGSTSASTTRGKGDKSHC
jgi:hypothetical protein